ncbi:YchJ family protein [Crenobacter caeni]|uniref:UPF0225 protein GZH52_08740 n=1 Tax=Crenobacter caeni TaxID=2705474 RepID=A0A6B2KSH7_9NEIS|nr:YchJ family protein [Crenobacter caeni]NDV12887.1 YchJ family protein [Crenobacter caeni]
MKKRVKSADCPCGSGLLLSACCGPRLAGERPAETAEALMRSRYTAYALGDEAYLLATWHPSTRPDGLDLAADPVKWVGLSVESCTGGQAGDAEGRVCFVARYKAGGRAGRLAEDSRFLSEDGRWYYVDGEVG